MFARFLGAIRELERVPGQKLLRDWSDGGNPRHCPRSAYGGRRTTMTTNFAAQITEEQGGMRYRQAGCC
jgi:hypothetical protein